MKLKTLPNATKLTAINVETYVIPSRVTLGIETDAGYVDVYMSPELARAMVDQLRSALGPV